MTMRRVLAVTLAILLLGTASPAFSDRPATGGTAASECPGNDTGDGASSETGNPGLNPPTGEPRLAPLARGGSNEEGNPNTATQARGTAHSRF